MEELYAELRLICQLQMGTQTNEIGYAFLWLPSKIFSSNSIESAMEQDSKGRERVGEENKW